MIFLLIVKISTKNIFTGNGRSGAIGTAGADIAK